jgi:glycosyltransferase involved in cell wall biosynthesis
MSPSWLRRFGRGAEPVAPGPRGRILFLGPFAGGIGGIERITRCFADWVRGSGYAATFVVRHVFPGGPYEIPEDPRLEVLEERRWGRALAEADWNYVYVIGAGLDRRRWLPRLARLGAPRVLLDLDRKRKWIGIADVLHCEAPRGEPLPRPHVVATPDPTSTMPPVEPRGDEGYYLTAFNPYGTIKGHHEIPAFLEAAGRPLVWCYDLTTWSGRRRKLARTCRRHVEALGGLPGLEPVEAPSRERLYDLYAGASGYVCFSRDESLGFSMLDAVALKKPLAARRIGVCRALAGFRETTDFGHPVFGTYELPAVRGYGALFERLPEVLGRAEGT